MSVAESKSSHMEWECPCCGQAMRPKCVLYHDSVNDDHVFITVADNCLDDTGYDKLDRAVKRLAESGDNHHFRVAGGGDFDMIDCSFVSCTTFEEYVDATLSGKEWSWS